MFGNDEKIRELRILAEPLVSWLQANSLPDTKIEITQTNVVLLEQPLSLSYPNLDKEMAKDIRNLIEAEIVKVFHEKHKKNCSGCCENFPIKLSFYE